MLVGEKQFGYYDYWKGPYSLLSGFRRSRARSSKVKKIPKGFLVFSMNLIAFATIRNAAKLNKSYKAFGAAPKSTGQVITGTFPTSRRRSPSWSRH
jgi:hypothetical protein